MVVGSPPVLTGQDPTAKPGTANELPRPAALRSDSGALRGAPMEGLFELVAASFIRHGIECPAGDSVAKQWTRPPEPPALAALPEHSFRKKSEAELAT